MEKPATLHGLGGWDLSLWAYLFEMNVDLKHFVAYLKNQWEYNWQKLGLDFWFVFDWFQQDLADFLNLAWH